MRYGEREKEGEIDDGREGGKEERGGRDGEGERVGGRERETERERERRKVMLSLLDGTKRTLYIHDNRSSSSQPSIVGDCESKSSLIGEMNWRDGKTREVRGESESLVFSSYCILSKSPVPG